MKWKKKWFLKIQLAKLEERRGQFNAGVCSNKFTLKTSSVVVLPPISIHSVAVNKTKLELKHKHKHKHKRKRETKSAWGQMYLKFSYLHEGLLFKTIPGVHV